ncbi:MAG: peptide chain release factor N(5)-glutamine methyltransferase [Bacillota bacterium]
MNIKEVLALTEEYLQANGVEEPRLDAEVLLADLLDMERIKLYVNFDYPLTDEELAGYRERVKKRAKHLPVAYITGHKEFMSLDFYVDQSVLIPRPETEHLVAEVIAHCEEKELEEANIVDVGTGSGAIMVSLGSNLPGARIAGIDCSGAALAVAEKNIEKQGLEERLKVIKGDLLQPFVERGKSNVDIVVSNPPYIARKEMEELPPEVLREPEAALNGGRQGLELYQRLIPQAHKVLRPGGFLFLEIGCKQAEEVKQLLAEGWEQIEVKKDYSGLDRVIKAGKVGD